MILVICCFLTPSDFVRTSAATAVCCHGFLKVGLPQVANDVVVVVFIVCDHRTGSNNAGVEDYLKRENK